MDQPTTPTTSSLPQSNVPQSQPAPIPEVSTQPIPGSIASLNVPTPALVPEVPSSVLGKLKQRFSKLPIGIKLVAGMGVVLLVLLVLSTSAKKPDTSTTVAPTPTLTPLPVVTSGPTYTPVPQAGITPPTTNWTVYPNGGHLAEYGMTITYPFGWTAKYKANTQLIGATKAVDFDFVPAYMTPNASASGNMGWGGMHVYLFQSINSLDMWLKKFYPSYVNNSDERQATDVPPGGYSQVYDIIPKSADLPTLYVTSGSKYFYQFVFTTYNASGSAATIHSTIFPKMRID